MIYWHVYIRLLNRLFGCCVLEFLIAKKLTIKTCFFAQLKATQLVCERRVCISTQRQQQHYLPVRIALPTPVPIRSSSPLPSLPLRSLPLVSTKYDKYNTQRDQAETPCCCSTPTINIRNRNWLVKCRPLWFFNRNGRSESKRSSVVTVAFVSDSRNSLVYRPRWRIAMWLAKKCVR
jgi:hypothetical protein